MRGVWQPYLTSFHGQDASLRNLQTDFLTVSNAVHNKEILRRCGNYLSRMASERGAAGAEEEPGLKAEEEPGIEEGVLERGITGAEQRYDFPWSN